MADDGRKQKGKSLAKTVMERMVRRTTRSIAAMKNKDSQKWGKPCREQLKRSFPKRAQDGHTHRHSLDSEEQNMLDIAVPLSRALLEESC